MPWAHPSSRLMVVVSKLAACQVSSWLMAVLGLKLDPRSQPLSLLHFWAFSVVQRSAKGFLAGLD